MIPLRTHAAFDYMIGIVLALSPWLGGFNDLPNVTNMFVVLGSTLIIYSLFTKYEFSIAPVIPLGLHMTFDALIGVTLILAPSVLGYRGLLTTGQEALHYLLGLSTIGLVLFTKPRTEQERTDQEIKLTSQLPLHPMS